MARNHGKSTSPEDLRGWPYRKLSNEIRKQIRSDVGGGDMRKKFENKAKKAGIPEEYVGLVADLQITAAKNAVKGSRERIESKLFEIDRRVEELERYITQLLHGMFSKFKI